MERVELLLLIMLALSLRVGSGGGNHFIGKLKGRCSTEERDALINFKRSLSDPQHYLSNWDIDEDCCEWKGVDCNNTTGNVIKIDLSGGNDDYDEGWAFYARSFDPSLFCLQHLQYLCLNAINFNNASIPQSISSLTNLYYLDLSNTALIGVIPPHLGNLTKLQHLDLGGNSLATSNLLWMSHLSSLQYLDMSYVDLTPVVNWLHEIKILHSLSTLILESCNLQTLPNLLPYSNFSSTIREFDLSSNRFSNHRIPSWLFNMTNIEILYLEDCKLQGVIPNNFLATLHKLEELDLSINLIDGCIPQCIGNMSNLEVLRLALNWLSGSIPYSLGQLSKLHTLDLRYNNLYGRLSDLHFINLSQLTYLYLSYNRLSGSIPYSLGQLSKLQTLALSFNQLNGSLSDVHFIKLSQLTYLYLRQNQLSGYIPYSLGQLSKLHILDLSYNQLNGSLSDVHFINLSQLTYLYLRQNQLSGSIPYSLGQLSKLHTLDLSYNQLNGSLSDVHFVNLAQLQYLSLSSNQLDFNMISLNWVPPFQLLGIYLRSCPIGPKFPSWLKTQKSLGFLDLSNSNIFDIIPSWFLNIFSGELYLNMSHNAIIGEFPMSLNIALNANTIDLSSNILNGYLPWLTGNVEIAIFSNNNFSKGIERYLNANMNSLKFLDLSHNHLYGEIPDSICQMPSLVLLYLSHNNLSGEVPKCSKHISSIMTLKFISLSNNNIWGLIPQWVGDLPMLLSLYLSNNNFHGEIPFFRNCRNLIILDLGKNKLTGTIPSWIGEKLFSLKILCLRSNKFYGPIPSNLSNLKRLQILYLADNFLSGSLPKSLMFLNSMTIKNKLLEPIIPEEVIVDIANEVVPSYPGVIQELYLLTSLIILINGVYREVTIILDLEIIMDLSCNNLNGEVPIELMNLIGLRGLNLSANQFIGHIPLNIDVMQSLEILDLSRNYFSGEIPKSIAKLDKLSHLNLSYNQLYGRIPTGAQLDTFDDSSYFGNPDLCGKPLNKTCEGDEHDTYNGGSNSQDEDDDFGLFFGMGLGFAIGLWSVLGILLLKKSWAIAYFQLYHNIIDNIYVFAVVKVNQVFNR